MTADIMSRRTLSVQQLVWPVNECTHAAGWLVDWR